MTSNQEMHYIQNQRNIWFNINQFSQIRFNKIYSNFSPTQCKKFPLDFYYFMSSLIKLHSPQVSKTIETETQQKEDIYRSLKVQKSNHFISDQKEDDKSLMLRKKAKQELSIFNDNLFGNETLQPKYSINILNRGGVFNISRDQIFQETQLNTIRNEDEQYETTLNIRTKYCCFCQKSKKLIQICTCSFAHQSCATQYIKSDKIINRIYCQACKQKYHLIGQVFLDCSRWKNNKLSLFIKLIILLIIIIITYFYGNKKKEQLTELICIFVVGFVFSVCIVTQILQSFKNIKFEIKRFNPNNIEFNDKYLEEFLDI